MMYLRGQGVPKDDTVALQWYRRAAEQGDAEGQINLAGMYNLGLGVSTNNVLAYMWYNLGAVNGYPSSAFGHDSVALRATQKQIIEARQLSREGADGRDGLAAKMTLEQISEAQQLSREWKPGGHDPGATQPDEGFLMKLLRCTRPGLLGAGSAAALRPMVEALRPLSASADR